MRGRLEALMTIGDGETFTVNDGGGADLVTIPPGEHYWSDLLPLVETAIETAVGSGFTLTRDWGASGSGRIVIAKNAGTAAIVFGSLDQAALFGFDSTSIPAAASHTSDRAVLGVWIPNQPMNGANLTFGVDGHLVTDLRQSTGPTGIVTSDIGASNVYRRFRQVEWQRVARDRAFDESVVPSWDRFRRLCLFGGSPYFSVANATFPTLLVYVDADNDTVLGTTDGEYRWVLSADGELPQPTPGWDGQWTVSIQQLIKT